MRGCGQALFLGLCFIPLCSAQASTLYSSTSNGASGANTLRINDQVTGQPTIVGPIGLTGARDMTSDTRAQSPRLWATSSDTGGDLYLVNPTGGSTLVGHMNTATNMRTLAFDVTTGRMFGTTYGKELYQIDPATAAVTLVGAVSNIAAIDFDSLAFDQQGTLWTSTLGSSASQLYTINPATAVATFKVTTDHTTFFSDLAFRPEDNALFGIDNFNGKLFTINTTTGVATPLASAVGDGTGLAFGVPEPGCAAIASVASALSLLCRRTR